ncbi:MAG: ATP synthase F1 subunit delta [Lactobacillus sp.]|nr:F0F1 ATP synthase subunit delta [Lactobacillus sp.]MDN6043110.1 F0F1 ATP synthase subunit delta [Lactobacillus sp.]MDN6052370.1 F0F1 ATP synthase subunit delta [Lactobacillus sp.]
MAISNEERAIRYGQALFAYAQDADKLALVRQDLTELQQALGVNPKFVAMLTNPVLALGQKQAMLKAVEAGLAPETQNFLDLLLDYGRFNLLLLVIAAFNQLFDQAEGRASGRVTSSVTLTQAQLTELGASYAKKNGLKQVILKNDVDPDIIGGVVLQVGDYVIDGSIKHKLMKIRRQLMENK